MKKYISKFRWMTLLMVTSQLMLTGFVVYWLINQYQDEKTQLHAKLNHEYMTTHEQLVDSMLMKNLITPTLNDSFVISLNVTDNRSFVLPDDALQKEDLVRHIHNDTLATPHVFALKLMEGHAGDSLETDSMTYSLMPEEEMLVRSVRLFIDRTDESFRADPGSHVFFMQVEDTLFQSQLQGQFRKMGWNFRLEPLEQQASQSDPELLPGLVLLNSDESTPQFVVQKFGPYIFRRMLAQYLFALILIGLSASSLLMARRSLNKQMVLNRLRHDFIANISHELKTPVSTVKIALEALRTYDLKKDPKVSGEYLEMASRELKRLEGLVAKVLQHETLEDPSALFQKEVCDLSILAERVVQTLELPIKEKGAVVHVSKSEEPVTASIDPVYVEGVILNLLDNSLKYAGPQPVIQIGFMRFLSGSTISVQDNGPGIPDVYKNQVFQKFFRIPSGNRHEVKGHGLGLNFAAQVMKHHGGSISFRNLSNGGCEFILHFPNA